MLHPDQIKEAEAYCAEHPTCGKCRKVMTPENSTACPEYFLCDDCAKEHGFEPRSNIGSALINQAEEHYEKRITELEGKIARAKYHLESSKIHGLLRGNLGFIDAALKELK